jgi:hypothetical protein
MRRALAALIVFGLLLVSSVAAPIAAAQETETGTSTGTSTSTDGETAEIMSVVEDGPAVSEERARTVYDYLAQEGTTALSEDQLRRMYRWMLRRSSSEYVPEQFIEDVGGALPESDRERLRDAYAPEPTPTATATPEPTPTPNGSSTSSGDATVIERVDNVLVISGYSYDADNETFAVTLRHTDPDASGSSITITEVMSQRDAGSGTFGIATLDLDPGETETIAISAKRTNGAAAVMVVSERSVEDRTGTYLQESRRSSGGLISGRASGADVRTAGFFGVFGALLVAFAAAWQRHVLDNRDVADAELKPKMSIFGRFRK